MREIDGEEFGRDERETSTVTIRWRWGSIEVVDVERKEGEGEVEVEGKWEGVEGGTMECSPDWLAGLAVQMAGRSAAGLAGRPWGKARRGEERMS